MRLQDSQIQLNYSKRIKNLLNPLKETEALGKKCFEIASDHTGCDDDTLLALFKIEMEVWFDHLTKEKTFSAEAMLDVGKKAFRFFKLDEIASGHAYEMQQYYNRANGIGFDPVETYMAYFHERYLCLYKSEHHGSY